MITCGNGPIYLDQKNYTGKTTIKVVEEDNLNLLDGIQIPMTTVEPPISYVKPLELIEPSFFEFKFDSKRSLISILKIVFILIIIVAIIYAFVKFFWCAHQKITCLKILCCCLKSPKSNNLRQLRSKKNSRPSSFDEVIYETVDL